MRLIDADVLKQHIDKLPALPDGNFAGNHSALKALINMQPTVQSEVIYCGECKHKGTRNCVANALTLAFHTKVKDDFYCGLGKRKTNGKTI